MKLIIQIPCYNEEETLPITFADLPKQIEGIDEIEYLIINDGSKDRTVEVAKELGIHHIVNFANNRGLAKGFMAGINACLKLGADIIVNTDADNQYCGQDIEKLVKPILRKEADMVIGERPIDNIDDFSYIKKKLQKIGSWVVRVVSNTNVPDAPSGFRAYSRECAMRLNVVSNYTYTLETIIQAGQNNIKVASVQIRTNPKTRESRLFSSMWKYIQRSVNTIIRMFVFYKPLKFFCAIGSIFLIVGLYLLVRFGINIYILEVQGRTYLPSIIVGTSSIIISIIIFVIGFLADIISKGRKLQEEILYRLRKNELDGIKNER